MHAPGSARVADHAAVEEDRWAALSPKYSGHAVFGTSHVALQSAPTGAPAIARTSPSYDAPESPAASPLSPRDSPRSEDSVVSPVVTWEESRSNCRKSSGRKSGRKSSDRKSGRKSSGHKRAQRHRQPATPYHPECDESDFDDMSSTVGDALDQLTSVEDTGMASEVEETISGAVGDIDALFLASEPAWIMPGQSRVSLQHR